MKSKKLILTTVASKCLTKNLPWKIWVIFTDVKSKLSCFNEKQYFEPEGIMLDLTCVFVLQKFSSLSTREMNGCGIITVQNTTGRVIRICCLTCLVKNSMTNMMLKTSRRSEKSFWGDLCKSMQKHLLNRLVLEQQTFTRHHGNFMNNWSM